MDMAVHADVLGDDIPKRLHRLHHWEDAADVLPPGAAQRDGPDGAEAPVDLLAGGVGHDRS